MGTFILLLLIVVVFWFLITYNKIVRMIEEVNNNKNKLMCN